MDHRWATRRQQCGTIACDAASQHLSRGSTANHQGGVKHAKPHDAHDEHNDRDPQQRGDQDTHWLTKNRPRARRRQPTEEETARDRDCKTAHRQQKSAEYCVISLANAVVDERTVVVIAKHAAVAISAVFGPRRLHHVAIAAPAVTVSLKLVHYPRFWLGRERCHIDRQRGVTDDACNLLLEPWQDTPNVVSRDDPWIRTRSRQHKHYRNDPENKGACWQQGADGPENSATHHKVNGDRDVQRTPRANVKLEINVTRPCDAATSTPETAVSSKTVPNLEDSRCLPTFAAFEREYPGRRIGPLFCSSIASRLCSVHVQLLQASIWLGQPQRRAPITVDVQTGSHQTDDRAKRCAPCAA
mmetsp:Transcript_9075/g.25351  ORF Transcript_9075/g.25351 Transcript_9075/m.25351 type:complete len:357 (+) Transcript_9075:95-1165(+)